MNGRNVSLDLMEFVEQNILPRYNSFDKAHRLSHVNHVIKQSLELALKCGADINMAYTIAAYHDLGLGVRVLYTTSKAAKYLWQIAVFSVGFHPNNCV